MASGKKDRVVISCVTFEVAKIVEPVEYYEASRVHLFNTSSDDEGNIYREFLDEVCHRIEQSPRNTEIVKHISRMNHYGEYDFTVFNFSAIMREILCVIEEEIEKCGGNVEIFINISAGTSEYSAASLIASMMYPEQTIPFTVSTAEYSVPADKVREVYYENGVPVGQTKRCKIPQAVSTYRIDMPDREKVLALGVMKEQIDKGDSCAATMMSLLRNKGLFEEYSVKEFNHKPEQKDIMKYQRNYIDYWLENNWIEKLSKRRYKITELGNEILSVFGKSFRQNNP